MKNDPTEMPTFRQTAHEFARSRFEKDMWEALTPEARVNAVREASYVMTGDDAAMWDKLIRLTSTVH